ncbi:hypothetical protein CFP56_039552 [Quercus suber]|uniref:Uncharacterized protein n=1 Tax=Quercus suber TaxID=58331 RepID=A0AAW0IYW3_QUESU
MAKEIKSKKAIEHQNCHENPQDRPTILAVVVLLGIESIVLPQPKHPAFSLDRFVQIDEFSINELSFSSIVPQ